MTAAMLPLTGAALLALAGVAAGPWLARARSVRLKRLAGWLLIAVLAAAAERLAAEADPIVRMVAICCALLGGMKGLVYAEWAVGRRLAPARYLVFALCWFGMDPGSFRTRRRGLTWRHDVALGAMLAVAGGLGTWLVASMGWRHILVMFVPLSLWFHFGILRMLKGGLRSAGFPVRTLFPNVLEARGIGDFWGRRWNTGYSQMMQRLVGKPVTAVLGGRAGLMAVFLVSGLLHELAITVPSGGGYGGPTMYFTLHGLLALLERRIGRPFGRVPALLLVMAPLGLLFPAAFQTDVIARCLDMFPAMS